MRMKSFKPNCNLNTIRDGRGAIFTFVPDAPILEWTHQFIKAGKIRGNHCHPEFDEYILLVDGAGVEVEKDEATGQGKLHLHEQGRVHLHSARNVSRVPRHHGLPVGFVPDQALG